MVVKLTLSERPPNRRLSSQGPLFSRLRESKSAQMTHGNRRIAPRVPDVKEAIRRNLERILNARCSASSLPADQQPMNVLAHYGLPDFSDLSWNARRIDAELITWIERVIEQFERRLTNVRVELDRSPADKTARTLRISADLVARTGPIPVAFQTRIGGELRPLHLSAGPR